MGLERGVLYCVVGILLASAFIVVPQRADADSGSFTVAPGETKYLHFGTCAVGDLILWDLEISTWSTIVEYWLQSPSGTHFSLSSLTWGRVVETWGDWKLGFHIDESGWWDATVYYVIYRTTPEIEIQSPLDTAYLSGAEVVVSGSVDEFADKVALSLDNVHYNEVDLYVGSWTGGLTLPADGEHTIYSEATINWGSYWVKCYDSVTVTLDTTPPEVVIITPAHNAWVAGEFTLSWQCSDECGIALKEVRVDLLEWVEVEGCEFSCDLESLGHWVAVRVTDLAGNRATASVNFFCDSNEPAVYLTAPDSGSKIDRDTVTVSWTGFDLLSGIDHYEVRISGGEWIYVGAATNHTFTGLKDQWYSVTVRAVDKVGNSRESSASFGIYTSIWSENGPYQGIPLFALIAAIIIGAVLITMLFRRRRGGPAVTTAPEEPSPEQPLEGVPVAD